MLKANVHRMRGPAPYVKTAHVKLEANWRRHVVVELWMCAPKHRIAAVNGYWESPRVFRIKKREERKKSRKQEI